MTHVRSDFRLLHFVSQSGPPSVYPLEHCHGWAASSDGNVTLEGFDQFRLRCESEAQLQSRISRQGSTE